MVNHGTVMINIVINRRLTGKHLDGTSYDPCPVSSLRLGMWLLQTNTKYDKILMFPKE